MKTASIPAGVLLVSVSVLLSRIFFQSKTVMSAARPSLRKPRSLIPYLWAAAPDILIDRLFQRDDFILAGQLKESREIPGEGRILHTLESGKRIGHKEGSGMPHQGFDNWQIAVAVIEYVSHPFTFLSEIHGVVEPVQAPFFRNFVQEQAVVAVEVLMIGISDLDILNSEAKEPLDKTKLAFELGQHLFIAIHLRNLSQKPGRQ